MEDGTELKKIELEIEKLKRENRNLDRKLANIERGPSKASRVAGMLGEGVGKMIPKGIRPLDSIVRRPELFGMKKRKSVEKRPFRLF